MGGCGSVRRSNEVEGRAGVQESQSCKAYAVRVAWIRVVCVVSVPLSPRDVGDAVDQGRCWDGQVELTNHKPQ